MKDVSVVLLTTGEKTTKRAIDSLSKQTLQPVETIIIENVTPFHNAINSGIRRVKTDYFLQMDSDFVLDENCIEILRNSMLPQVAMAIGQLRDPISGIVSGVKMYRTTCFKHREFKNDISPETDIIKEVCRDGWKIVYPINADTYNKKMNTLGEHNPDYTPLYTYLRFYRLGLKLAYRKEAYYIKSCYEKLHSSKHKYALIAKIAFSNGFLGDTNGSNYLSPEYLKTNPKEFAGLKEFLIDDKRLITNGFDVSTINKLDPMTMFTKFVKLGEWLRKNYTLRGFKYYLDVIDRCEKDYSWIGKAALCNGILSDEISDRSIEKKYNLVKDFLSYS